MPNYRRADASGACYFFTVVTFRRRNILTNDDCRVWLRNAVLNTWKHYPFAIDAWVLLPDHLHTIWTLPENDNDFSVRWNGIKRRFTMMAKQKLHKPEWVNASKRKHREGTIWQRLFGTKPWMAVDRTIHGAIVEHQIRDENDYENHINYIHYNPVKHGLVNSERMALFHVSSLC